MFRQVYIQTCQFTARLMFEQFNVQTGLFTDKSMLRQVGPSLMFSQVERSDKSKSGQIDVHTGQ